MTARADQPFFDACRERIQQWTPVTPAGRVTSVRGSVIEAEGVVGEVGGLCEVGAIGDPDAFAAEVVGFRDGHMLLLPAGDPAGLAPGIPVRPAAEQETPRAAGCLGRVVDGLGRPIDGGPPISREAAAPATFRPRPMDRRRVDAALDLGVRSINALLTVARGARIGLFAGGGVGKSTLLGQIARSTEADAIVVALVGERGREVREFVETQLAGSLERSIVVVATSDEPALLRRRAAFLASALAEQLRESGRHVLLLMDSATRLAAAQREIGLAAGEPPATRGYPPSLWSILPRLLERAGNDGGAGSITGIYTVLVEGDDLDEPVADAMRALLDGHLVLSRELAARGHFPAIDVLGSVSRLMGEVTDEAHQQLAQRVRALLAAHQDAADLVAVGAYVAGSDPATDEALRLHGSLTQFLRQRGDERVSLEESVSQLGVVLSGRAPAAVVAA